MLSLSTTAAVKSTVKAIVATAIAVAVNRWQQHFADGGPATTTIAIAIVTECYCCGQRHGCSRFGYAEIGALWSSCLIVARLSGAGLLERIVQANLGEAVIVAACAVVIRLQRCLDLQRPVLSTWSFDQLARTYPYDVWLQRDTIVLTWGRSCCSK